MKKMVMACMCDICGKQVEETTSRYTVRFGVGNWTNDVVQQTNEKDLCRECYDLVRDILKFDQGQKPSIKKKAEVAASDGTIKKRGSRKSKYDLERFEELFCDGWSNRRIEQELGMPKGMASYHVKNLVERGLTRGQNLLPEYKENPVRMRTMVDGSGFVVKVD